MRITAVGDPLTIQALKLMGIAGEAAVDARSASQAFRKALAPETVVLVTESVAKLIREEVSKAKIARQDYVVLEIPSTQGVPDQAEETARLVSQAIGVKV